MKSPFISIITPAYKVENTLKRTVLSAIKQDFLDWEMVVISDDHQDYEQVLRAQNISDQRLRFTSTNQLGSGSSNARNRGLAIAEGQYIACLDADDEFRPNKLSKMIPLVEEYGAAVSEVEMRDSDSSALLDKFNKSSDSPCLSPK
ncbi:MAG: glycosyltransferase family 2 protein, partial [Microcystaceae cyanobacterium]